jgi:hypothetical protein
MTTATKTPPINDIIPKNYIDAYVTGSREVQVEACGETLHVNIETGVPVTPKGAWGRGAVIRQMKVGESIVVPLNERTGFTAHGKSQGITLISRRVEKTDTVRIWRTA